VVAAPYLKFDIKILMRLPPFYFYSSKEVMVPAADAVVAVMEVIAPELTFANPVFVLKLLVVLTIFVDPSNQ
jgi:hypothetical protein